MDLVAAAAGAAAGVGAAAWGRRGSYLRPGQRTRLGAWWWLQVPLQAVLWGHLEPVGWWALPGILYALTAGVAAFVDIDVHRMPNVLTAAAGIATGSGVVLAAAATNSWDRAAAAAAGGAGLFLAYLAIAMVGTMGGGDIKLAASTGMVLAADSLPTLFAGAFLGIVIGAIAGLVLIGVRRQSLKTPMPMGPAIAAGAVTALVLYV